jgi:hypothetical protein
MDSPGDRERLVPCRGDVVYRLRRRRQTGLVHRLRCMWYRESYVLATGLHAVAASIGIVR